MSKSYFILQDIFYLHVDSLRCPQDTRRHLGKIWRQSLGRLPWLQLISCAGSG